jgi:hypothetical protein
MAVPKLAKNGFYSPFRFYTFIGFPFSTQAPMVAPNAENRIKTIFDHFRNTHARYCAYPSSHEKKQ